MTNCFNADCPFLHPQTGKVCNFGASCIRPHCMYRHPPHAPPPKPKKRCCFIPPKKYKWVAPQVQAKTVVQNKEKPSVEKIQQDSAQSKKVDRKMPKIPEGGYICQICGLNYKLHKSRKFRKVCKGLFRPGVNNMPVINDLKFFRCQFCGLKSSEHKVDLMFHCCACVETRSSASEFYWHYRDHIEGTEEQKSK